MSIQLMAEVFRLDLSPTEKLVLLALADAAGDEGHTWIPVRRRGTQLDRNGRQKLDLLTKTSLSERAVQQAIKRLVESKYLTRNEICGKGVEYLVTPASGAGRNLCGAHEKTLTPASGAGKPSVIVKTVTLMRECPDDFWPEAKPGSETAKRMESWKRLFLAQQVEKFVAYHQARGTKSKNWNRNWTTWALNNFDGKAQADERLDDGQSGSALVRAATSLIAANGSAGMRH